MRNEWNLNLGKLPEIFETEERTAAEMENERQKMEQRFVKRDDNI